VAFVLLVPLLLLGFAWWQFNRIERVDVGDALSPGGGAGTNYLIVGSDSREGIEAGDPNADAFIGSTVTGERTDTIMVLRMEGDQSFLLSIPRDLWVTNSATGDEGRINAVYRSGPPALIDTVEQNVGIPIHHYLEIDFVSFGGLVDSVGGITIDFPHPARDDASGLVVDQAGPVELDGPQALAYVRSRTYTELIDGEWRTDPTGDLGRTERQRQFLSALVGRATASRNPFSLMSMARSLGGGLAIDNHFTFFGALGLAWRLRGFSPESVVQPTVGRTTSGGAAVREIDEPAAAPQVAHLSA
jgi:LCP family protein required for cell wall assembly